MWLIETTDGLKLEYWDNKLCKLSMSLDCQLEEAYELKVLMNKFKAKPIGEE